MHLGNDPAQMTALADALARAGWSLHDSAGELTEQFERVCWNGAARQRTAAAVHRAATSARRCRDGLLRASTTVRRQAEDQRAHSTPVPALGRAPETVLFDDPTGDGRRVVAVGDLDRADSVAVVVPGIGSTAATFGGLLNAARRLQHDAAAFRGESDTVAVVAWLGYDAPGGAGDPSAWDEVLTRDLATRGAEQLGDFLADLDADGDARITVIGHSYGSIVAAGAAKGGHVDRLVLVGSPGVGANTVDELGLDDRTTVYAAATTFDPVARSGWFGRPPTDPDFGAEIVDASPEPGSDEPSPAHAHSAYFDDGSAILERLAALVAGRFTTLDDRLTRTR